MSELRVKEIDLFAIGPDGKKVTWSSFLGPMCEAMIVARITMENGLQGLAGLTTYTEHEFDLTVFNSASLLAPFLLGRDVSDIDAIHTEMMGKYVPLKNMSASLINIALYDAKAKSQNLPLYKMLGGARDKIRAYASSPLFDTPQEYVTYCHEMLEEGFNAIKIHPRCVFKDDFELVQILNEEFSGQSIGWSLDTDGCYTLEEALMMGELLDKTNWEFFEAPIPDDDFDGYKTLVLKLDLDVIAGGNALPSPSLIKYALQNGVWDRSRFDVTGIGGFTGATRVMNITDELGKEAEVQSWGYTLTQAANLHLMLAYDNCEYFEQAAPYEKYEFGAKQVIRPDEDGFVHPSGLPGLGIELNWDVLDPFIYASRKFQA